MRVRQVEFNEWMEIFCPIYAKFVAKCYSISSIEDFIRLEMEFYSWINLTRANLLTRLFVIGYKGGVFPVLMLADYFGRGFVLTYPGDLSSYDLHSYYKENFSCVSPILDNQGKSIDWMIVDKDYSSFNEFVRKGVSGIRLISHFFGQKSQEVKWQTVKNLDRQDLNSILTLSMQHRLDFQSKFKDTCLDLGKILDGGMWSPTKMFGGDYVLATDWNKQVCSGMFILKGKNVDNASVICRNTSEEYKKYSLVLSAHVQAIRSSVYEEGKRLNLGLNFNEMPYKDFIQHKKIPAVCFPTIQDPNISTEDLASLLWRDSREDPDG